MRKGYDEEAAKDIVELAQQRDRKVIFIEADSEADAFFSVESKPGVTQIVLNTQHPAFGQLMRVLDASTEGATERDLVDRIHNANDTLRMLLAAWARYEIEDIPNRKRIRDIRQDWGRIARDFLEDE